ncbi:hypothetical protein JXR93_13830 [bacterium]|nr:hypothetical protein [bacterium]
MSYKKSILTIFLLISIQLLGTDFSGKWELSTFGANRDVTIKQSGNKMELYRVIQDEDYKVNHLIMGKVEGLEEEKQYKLYVKDDDMEEFELLRDIPLKQLSDDELMLDGVELKRLTPVIGKNKTETKQNKNNPQNNSEIDETNNKNNTHQEKSSEPQINLDNVIDVVPGGLSDSFSGHIKISAISSEKDAMIKKGERLIAKKEWKKAASQFHKIEKKWKNSVVVYPYLLKIYQKLENRGKISYYCDRIKRFEPNHSCGGDNE